MKKIAFLLFMAFIGQISFAQQRLEIFDSGPGIGVKPVAGDYIVIESEGTADELYQKVLLHVNQLMVNPEASIVGNQPGVLLKWRTHDGEIASFNVMMNYYVNVTYSTSVFFKDGKIRVEYAMESCVIDNHTRIDPFNYAKGNGTFYAIVKKNGTFTSYGEETKATMEAYFNAQLDGIEKALNNEAPQNSDW